MIFETHAHYDDEAFNEDRQQLLSSMKDAGIGNIVNIGANMASSHASLELAHKYDFIYAAVGVHPSDTEELDDDKLEELRVLSRDARCLAIGEIGLDYYWPEPDHGLQKKWFRRQITLAKEEKLPIVIHSRDAAADTLSILKEENAAENGGVVHCFSYSAEIAKQCVDMGFYIGVGGVITFKNGRRLKETVDMLSLENIILETDSPYLAPTPYRGKRNCSLYLPLVADAIAEIKGVPAEEVIRITEENAKKMYRIDD